jgi:Ca2+-binding RTX toxin-like protein
MVTNILRVGAELQLNQSPNVVANQLQSDVSAMTDGGFFVAYESEGTNTTDVAGRFVNANATLGAHSSGNTGPVNDSGFHNGPAVTARPGGAAFVSWGDSFSGDIEYTAIGTNGKNQITTGPDTGGHINLGEDDSNSRPDAATFADGDIILVYQWVVDSTDRDIKAKIIPASGLAFTPPTHLFMDAADSLSESPAVAASGSKALVAYADSRDDQNAATTDNFDIRIAVFDKATMQATIGNGRVDIADKASNLGNVDVAALKDGRYVVVYEDVTNNDIYARLVTADGNAVGSEIIIAKTSSGESMPRVAALADGGFVVTWDQRTDGVDDVMARRFLSDGTPGGDRFRVNAEAGNSSGSSIAANKDGKFFISFTSKAPAGDGDGSSVRGSVFEVSAQPLNGSANPDTITAYNLGEKINGLAGDDTINARGGDDSVDGGEGDDTLNGDNGNDLIAGGPGNDGLTGGAGADRFLFNTKIKAKGGNVDTISDFSAAEDTILLDNAIFKKLKAEGALQAKYFEIGKKAKSGKDAIIYNDKTGDLIYDTNGKKKGGALVFAKLEGIPADVSVADFVVI